MEYILASILTISLALLVVRFTPFLLFRNNRPIPKFITYMTILLPLAIIPMLIIYSLKSTPVLTFPYGIPEAIGILSVIALHRLFKNTFVSIIASTAIYMILVQTVF